MRTRRTTLAATLAIASLALAACGGGDEGEETAAAPSVAEAPEFEPGTTMA